MQNRIQRADSHYGALLRELRKADRYPAFPDLTWLEDVRKFDHSGKQRNLL